MEKKEVKEDNSKTKMERARKADNQIEVISHLMSMQLFCIFLRNCASSLDSLEPKLCSEMSVMDHVFGEFFGYGMMTLILITFPWSFKAAAKGLASARSWSRYFMISLLIWFFEVVVTYDAYIYNPDLDSATSKAFALLLLKCSSMIYLVIMIYHCFLTYQMFHLIKKPKKDEPKQQMKQKVSNPEKATKISIENEKLDVKKIEV